MNINPLIILVSQIIYLYNLILIIYIIGEWLINFNVLSTNNIYVYKVMHSLSKIVEPLLNKIRKFLPDLGGLDISPIILILLLNFLKNILFTYFYVAK